MKTLFSKTLQETALEIAAEQEERYVMTTGRTVGKSTAAVLSAPYGGYTKQTPENAVNELIQIADSLLVIIEGMVMAARTERELYQAAILMIPILNKMHGNVNGINRSDDMAEVYLVRLLHQPIEHARIELCRELSHVKRAVRGKMIINPPDHWDEIRDEFARTKWPVYPRPPMPQPTWAGTAHNPLQGMAVTTSGDGTT